MHLPAIPISLGPEGDGRQVVEALENLERSLANIWSASSTSNDARNAYVACIDQGVRVLRWQLGRRDLEELLLTRRYWALTADQAPTPSLSDVLNTEAEDRRYELRRVINALSASIARWSGAELLVVPDSSAFYAAPLRLGEWDIRASLSLGSDQRVRLLLPMVVVDELDRLKENPQPHKRWRAGQALRVITGTVGDGLWGQMARQNKGAPQGVTLEVLVDPAGHHRLPIADDEIVERASAIAAVAGKPLTLLTSDTGQAMRGRHAGLGVVLMPSRHAAEFAVQSVEPPTPKRS